jgi:predicted glutamine amidotransferase
MCVIIVRQPGVTLPFDKLQTACKVNAHGWGLAVVDRGKITTRYELLESGNDPENVARALEDANDQLALLHLRFVTAGDKSLENCHPFSVLRHSLHGLDVVLAHNGTLYNYRGNGSDGPSDTKNFVRQYVTPLLERAVTFTGNANLLKDEFTVKLLEKEVSTNSVVTLLDAEGNVLNIHEGHGKQFDGWWASNTYSFNDDHRETKTTTTIYSSWNDYIGADDDGVPYGDDRAYGDTAAAEIITLPTTTTTRSPTIIKPKELDPIVNPTMAIAADRINLALQMAGKRPSASLIKKLLDSKRQTFCKITGIDHLREMTRFDPEDLDELVNFYPEVATVLLQDLLFELYLRDNKPLLHTAVPFDASTTNGTTHGQPVS